MKNGWEIKKLGEVCDFEGGSQPPKSQFIFDEKPGYVRFLQIRDFGSDKNITYIPHSKKNRLCTEQDILIGRYGASVGKILTDKAGAYNVALVKTIPNLNVINRTWFYNFLRSDEFQHPLLNVADRSAQAGFSKEDIYNFLVPVPPMGEQERIVGILDEAFEGIATAKANAERNLQNARALFESHLHSVFSQRGEGWEVKKLGEVCKIIMGQSPDGRSYNTMGIGVPLINGPVEFSDEPFGITIRSKFTTEPTKFCKEGDLILCVRGSTTGRMNIAGFDACVGRGVAAIRAKHYQPWVNQFIRSKRDEIHGKGTGATFPNVAGATLADFGIVMPPLPEQHRIVQTLIRLAAETQRLAGIYERKLVLLEELKKALLHRAFSGEL